MRPNTPRSFKALTSTPDREIAGGIFRPLKFDPAIRVCAPRPLRVEALGLVDG
jgi:hypothetical protein